MFNFIQSLLPQQIALPRPVPQMIFLCYCINWNCQAIQTANANSSQAKSMNQYGVFNRTYPKQALLTLWHACNTDHINQHPLRFGFSTPYSRFKIIGFSFASCYCYFSATNVIAWLNHWRQSLVVLGGGIWPQAYLELIKRADQGRIKYTIRW